MLTSSQLPLKGKDEAMTTRAWKTIANTNKSNDANRDHQVVEEQQVEPGPASEDDDDSIATQRCKTW